MVSICRKSRTFEDISEASKCPRADILSFFPALILSESILNEHIEFISNLSRHTLSEL